MATKIRIILLSFLLPALACIEAVARDAMRPLNEYTITAWTMEDGLPHNLIHRIAQDANGFLWVGTWEGAARFNGQHFTVFDARSSAGPKIIGVRGLVAEVDGSMLFGTTQSGIRRLSHDVWMEEGGAAAAKLKVTTLLRSRQGSLWIGTENSLYRLDADESLHAVGDQSGLDGNLILSLVELDNGDLLVGNNRGLHRWREGKIEALSAGLQMPLVNVRSLLERRDGSIVIGGDGGVWQGDSELKRVDRLTDSRAEAMIEDRKGALWISSSATGLMRHTPDRIEYIDHRLGLDGRGSSALFEDREGLIWVGTTNGLYRISDGNVFGIDEARGLSDGYARAVLQADDDSMWIGHSVGVDRWKDGQITAIDLSSGTPTPPSVLALEKLHDGSMLLGTYDQGVLRVDGNGGPSTQVSPLLDRNLLPSSHVRSLRQVADGSVWIGTTRGLSRFKDGVLRTYTTADGLPGDFIRVIHEARDGALWIGTSAGIARVATDGGIRAWHPGAEFPAVGSFDFLEDPDGTLWIASDSGLLRLRDEQFTVYNHAVGLPRDSVFRILDDGAGTLWLSSNAGVVGVRRSELDDIDAQRRQHLDGDVVDFADGMPSSQANGGSSPAGWRSRDGQLWFPTAMGVAVIDPDRDAGLSKLPAPIAFENVIIDGQRRPLAPHYKLGPEVRRLAISYAGLNFRATRDLRYRYRMAGFDDRWVEAGTANDATFTNLPPGQFRFEVQAMAQPVNWERGVGVSSASMGFDVEAPFWRSIWFIAVTVLATAAALLALISWRLGRYRRRQRQLRRLIQQRTAELTAKNDALEHAHREREKLLNQLAHQAHHDALTDLPNRRAGDQHLQQAVDAIGDAGSSLSVALIDIDDFKSINDRYGHSAGDAVLRMVATSLRDHLGREAFAARHGGEEFLITYQGLDLQQAVQRLERLREHIATTPVSSDGGKLIHCTVSIGHSRWQAGANARSLLASADQRLYSAKRRGRNQTVSDDSGHANENAEQL